MRIDIVMGDIGTADFERVPETIPLGEAAAGRRLRRLAPFARAGASTWPGASR